MLETSHTDASLAGDIGCRVKPDEASEKGEPVIHSSLMGLVSTTTRCFLTQTSGEAGYWCEENTVGGGSRSLLWDGQRDSRGGQRTVRPRSAAPHDTGYIREGVVDSAFGQSVPIETHCEEIRDGLRGNIIKRAQGPWSW
jgi:hypothetical protein